jgi:exopolysaccharide production protein ExoQ
MANESFALSFDAPPRLERIALASIAYFALAILVFVGFQPFIPPASGTPLAAANAAQGDLLHQIFYLVVFATVLLGAAQRRGFGAVRAVPLLFGLLQLWCVLSALWAMQHGISFRRAVLEVIITTSVLLSADTIGPERAFRYLRILLAVVLAVNWLSIPLIHTAVHLPGELDPGLIGDWRGLYGQKNAAGAVCALTAILFLFSHNGKYNWIGWLVSLFAVGFLVMTRSKTSLALLPVAVAAGLAYRAAWRDGLSRAIFAVLAALLIAVVAAASVLYADAISHILEDPTEFTGRAEIWQAYLAFVQDHPWLGAGYGMLSNTGGISPMHNYVNSAWVEAIGDSHDGYLQVLVMLGGVGFTLAILSLLIGPLARFWPLDYAQPGFKAMLFSLFIFFVLHNFMESDFLESDSGVWFCLLLVIAALRNPDKMLTGVNH